MLCEAALDSLSAKNGESRIVTHEDTPVEVFYRASAGKRTRFILEAGSDLKWRPSLFMPRWASRITLEITDVRVERVQDISLDDIRAEGVRCRGLPPEDEISYLMPIAFQSLWDDTNGKGAWDRNDWVWVIEFKRILETA